MAQEMMTRPSKESQQLSGEAREHENRRAIVPRTNVYEDSQNLILVVDLPGVREDDLNVTLENRRLSIRGEMNSPSEEAGKQMFSEFPVGEYERNFTLSSDIDRDNISAKMNSGVLTLTLPKASSSMARRIQIDKG